MMTIKEARAAIRAAHCVYVGVTFFENGDPQYVRTTKAEALAIVHPGAAVVAGRADVRCRVHDGDVYFN